MATNESIKNQLSSRKSTDGIVDIECTFEGIINSEAYRKIFNDLLKERASDYIASIIRFYNSEEKLKGCAESFIEACIVAAKLDLPIGNNMGYQYIVPYKGQAMFQLGYKGYIQLALRSGRYKSINVLEIHEGELTTWNPLTEELVIKVEDKKSDYITGYGAYIETLTGFKKAAYWSKEDIEKYKGKNPQRDFLWTSDYDGMAKKVVVMKLLERYSLLSSYMEIALRAENKD